MQRRAYVTALTNGKYFPGVFALQRGLRTVGSRYGLVVIVPEDRAEELAPRLVTWGLQVLTAPPVEIPDVGRSPHYWDDTFFKIRAAGLTGYDKVVLLDSDMLVLKNLDHLFERPSLSAVVAGNIVVPEWNQLNSGLLVIEPSAELVSRLLACLQPAIRRRLEAGLAAGDQDVFAEAFPDWPARDELHLPETYNSFWMHLEPLCKDHYKNGYKDISVVHFVGDVKPWQYTLRREIRLIINLVRERKFNQARALRAYRRYLRAWNR